MWSDANFQELKIKDLQFALLSVYSFSKCDSPCSISFFVHLYWNERWCFDIKAVIRTLQILLLDNIWQQKIWIRQMPMVSSIQTPSRTRHCFAMSGALQSSINSLNEKKLNHYPQIRKKLQKNVSAYQIISFIILYWITVEETVFLE